jgi:hypothetical protein
VIRENIREREIAIKKYAARPMVPAMLSRVHKKMGVWRQNFPPEIIEVIRADCTPPVQR